jgi:predicted dehydrogenase
MPQQTGRSRPYGILLVSGGHTHQEDYAAAFAADSRCRIVAVTDEADVGPQRRALNARLAHALGVPYLADLDEALARQDVDAVSICAAPERRGRIGVRCAEAGKHLYVDKPLAPSLHEADALVDAVRRAGVRSHMFSSITQPWAREAKRLVDDGRLGDLLGIHADVFFAKGHAGTATLGTTRREEYPPRRQQLAEAKRELDNIGVYPVCLVRWLTGRQFRTVFGTTANYFFAEHQKHAVEDFGLLACTLDGGVPVTIAAGRYGWTSHPAGGVNRLVLVGSERTALIDANGPQLEVCTDEPPWQPPAVHPEDPMSFWTSTQQEVGVQPKRAWLPVAPPGQTDASYFVDCLDAGRDSEMSAAEAALATEVLLAGYCSAATGEVVAPPLPRGAPCVRE